MENDILSVNEVATLCEVDHSTVGYWIRKKKLCAERSGGNYKIKPNDLLIYLKSSGRKIPPEFRNNKNLGTFCFRTIQNCWDYWRDNKHGGECKNCVVYLNSIKTCFIATVASNLKCSTECDECEYYNQIYIPRINFIHQFDHAAAIYKGMSIWGVNEIFADIFGGMEKEFIGIGVESLFHPDSLEDSLSIIKRKNIGDPCVPDTFHTYFKNRERGKTAVQIGLYSLKEPSHTFLMMAMEG